jgi:hypothetical protein
VRQREDELVMPPQHTDLETALEFVTRRIEDEALRSGEPLTEEEHHLLHHLPGKRGLFSSPSSGFNPATGGINILPRDFDYERLCALAKAAYNGDVCLGSPSADRWEFAAAVSKLNRHPIDWLLEWAGVKVRRQWWDRWILVAAALVFTALGFLLLFLAAIEPMSSAGWAVGGFGYIAVFVALIFMSGRLQAWQLKQTIQKCRLNAPLS